ncbi:heterokaryon incompatibility protein-domain-containing protein [Podospora aff. communis PSN243]|uniref:Heterokaryon incompatibility protein-domain-containing protein n=1 Tax=Podospora aff. communis PSN243 TaxID=3040156 RepID=A0AAV9H5M0_9PEZI|nr:heterokaryon incompatibility protein-domain-containing protein [Podospora aff. communis PSN243]
MAVRWHSRDCVLPSITVHLSEPRCETCGAFPQLDKLRQQQMDIPSLLPIPPDEPLGELNLRWPPTVIYSRDDGLDEIQLFDEDGLRAAAPGPSDCPVCSQSLGSSEIRLLLLSPSPVVEAPIHLTLEIFPEDDCPEYEAVSYTWGGEEGDSTPALPAYVGRYWDILLQTRNCHSMLRYLRRRDRLRTLWVDAICLNQRSAQEKAAQIPRMDAIYKRAMRDIAFLEDLPGKQRFPPRRTTADLEVSITNNMTKLRYFTRLWVIQELILARSVVFVYRGLEIHHDAAQGSKANRIQWFGTPAPWLRHLATQGFNEDEGLTGALHLTHASKSADIRDRIFGIEYSG